MSAGQPAYFQTVEEFESKVEEYFEWIQGEFHWECKTNDEGKEVDVKVFDRDSEPPTITGLCLFLGFESRQSYHDYAKRSEFSYAIKRARLRIENSYEIMMNYSRQPTAQIFALKNMGWSDRQEIDHTSNDGSMSPKTKIVFSKGSK